MDNERERAETLRKHKFGTEKLADYLAQNYPKEGKERTEQRTCQICGCTDSKACEGGCGWVIMFGKQIEICTKCITDRVPECIDLLVGVIMETHQEEIKAEHHGDMKECSTCTLIGFARKIEAALRQ